MSNAETRKRLTEEHSRLQERIKEIQKEFPSELGCSAGDCFEDAAWVRSTQFSGVHPFCDKHAREEKNFGTEGSSHFWETVSEYQKNKD